MRHISHGDFGVVRADWKHRQNAWEWNAVKDVGAANQASINASANFPIAANWLHPLIGVARVNLWFEMRIGNRQDLDTFFIIFRVAQFFTHTETPSVGI